MPLIAKLAVLLGLLTLLQLPLSMVESLSARRAEQRAAAAEEVASSSSGAQILRGPVLVVPYQHHAQVEEQVWVGGPGEQPVQMTKHKQVTTDRQLVVLPTELTIRASGKVTKRHRGLYQIPTWRASAELSGQFEFDPAELAKEGTITLGDAYVAVGLRDLRGLSNLPELQWDTTRRAMLPDARLAAIGTGVHAPLAKDALKSAGRWKFSLPLELLGTESLSFVPVGKQTTVELKADWPHPSFEGHGLPDASTVDGSGFSARWRSSWCQSSVPMLLRSGGDVVAALDAQAFGVRLVEPASPWQQTERALKYATLFLILTFGACFLFEAVGGIALHPMHYALTGAALATFYLLLLALSEHLPLPTAYALASGACSALLGYYLAFVLKRWWRGFLFGLGLSGLYAALYFVLGTEQSALLLGSLLLFGSLATLMVLTRRLDWSNVGRTSLPSP